MRHPFLKWEGGQIHTHPPPPDLCTLDSCDNMALSPLIWLLLKCDRRHFWTASAEPAGSLYMRSPAVCWLWRGDGDQCLLMVKPWWSESLGGVSLSGSSASLHSSKVFSLWWPLLSYWGEDVTGVTVCTRTHIYICIYTHTSGYCSKLPSWEWGFENAWEGSLRYEVPKCVLF